MSCDLTPGLLEPESRRDVGKMNMGREYSTLRLHGWTSVQGKASMAEAHIQTETMQTQAHREMHYTLPAKRCRMFTQASLCGLN